MSFPYPGNGLSEIRGYQTGAGNLRRDLLRVKGCRRSVHRVGIDRILRGVGGGRCLRAGVPRGPGSSQKGVFGDDTGKLIRVSCTLLSLRLVGDVGIVGVGYEIDLHFKCSRH